MAYLSIWCSLWRPRVMHLSYLISYIINPLLAQLLFLLPFDILFYKESAEQRKMRNKKSSRRDLLDFGKPDKILKEASNTELDSDGNRFGYFLNPLLETLINCSIARERVKLLGQQPSFFNCKNLLLARHVTLLLVMNQKILRRVTANTQ